MAIDKVRSYLARFGREKDIMEFPVSSATVDLAAAAVGCGAGQIAKTLAFTAAGAPLLVVAAGDAKVDNTRFKSRFGQKAVMIPLEEVEEAVGHAVGGVCPFGVPDGVPVYLDLSLRRFDRVYPACGSPNSAIRLTPAELESLSRAAGWVDVSKNWRPDEAGLTPH